MHDLAETLLDQAHALSDDRRRAPRYEHVRVGLSWGLRLERGGHQGSERLRAAADAADGMRRGASAVERPLLRAAGVLGRHAPGPAATTVERHLARHDVARPRAACRTSRRSTTALLVHVARARALERAGDADAAADPARGGARPPPARRAEPHALGHPGARPAPDAGRGVVRPAEPRGQGRARRLHRGPRGRAVGAAAGAGAVAADPAGARPAAPRARPGRRARAGRPAHRPARTAAPSTASSTRPSPRRPCAGRAPGRRS